MPTTDTIEESATILTSHDLIANGISTAIDNKLRDLRSQGQRVSDLVVYGAIAEVIVRTHVKLGGDPSTIGTTAQNMHNLIIYEAHPNHQGDTQ